MAELTTEIDMRKLNKALERVPKELKYQINDGFDYISRKFLKKFRAERLQGPPGIRGRPHGIFSRFRRASLISDGISGSGMIIYTDSKIAKLQEEGGTVQADAGKELTVPLSARTQMFTASGKLRKRYKRPRSLKNVIKLRLSGKDFLVKVKKRSREIIPLFVLKKKVRIRPRMGFYQTWDSMQNVRLNIINKKVEKALKKA